MIPWLRSHARHARGAAPALACAALLLLAAGYAAEPAAAGEPGAAGARRLTDRLDRALVSRCLTAEVGGVLSELVASGAVQPVLGDELALVEGDIQADRIELQIRDSAERTYGVVLALPGAVRGTPDAAGQRFAFHLQPPAGDPDPRATAALLALAELIDEAIPETALGRCAAAGTSDGEQRYPLRLALASAAAQIGVILAALLYGLYAIRPRD